MTKSTSFSFDLVLLQFIIDNAKIHWMEEDEGVISPTIRFEVTGGHTPFHQVFWVKENGETAFYGADNLPQLGYLKLQIAYKSDYDGKKAMEERQKWEHKAKEGNWQILLYHDMENAVIQL